VCYKTLTMRVLGIKISNEICRIAVRILQLFSVDACRVALEKQATISTIIIKSQNRIMYLWRRPKAKCVTEILRERVKLGSWEGVSRRLCLKCCKTHLQVSLIPKLCRGGGLYPCVALKTGGGRRWRKGKEEGGCAMAVSGSWTPLKSKVSK